MTDVGARAAAASARLAIAAAILATAACHGGKASKTDCAGLRERYMELDLAADPGLATLPEPQRAAAREMREALARGERAFKKVATRCEEVTDKEAECAMAAATLDAWDDCIR